VHGSSTSSSSSWSWSMTLQRPGMPGQLTMGLWGTGQVHQDLCLLAGCLHDHEAQACSVCWHWLAISCRRSRVRECQPSMTVFHEVLGLPSPAWHCSDTSCSARAVVASDVLNRPLSIALSPSVRSLLCIQRQCAALSAPHACDTSHAPKVWNVPSAN